jgi:amidohydrolase
MQWAEELVRWRRELHQIPELAFAERDTQAYLMAELGRLGIDFRPVAGTGLVAEVYGASAGPLVAVRADMDALPLDEQSDEPFASCNPGRMHACGHDGHMAIALGLAARLVHERTFSGTVRFLFQPAEEAPPGGALAMIREGALDGVASILGLHLWSTDPLGVVGIRPGPIMANADQFRIRIVGQGGHGSAPHETRDAVLVAAETVVNLQTIVSRRLSPLEPAVVTCGTLHAGQVFNVIAGTAEITGTVRTLTESTREAVEAAMRQIVEGTAAMHGARAEVTYERGYPALVNHSEVVTRWRQAIGDFAPVVECPPKMTGEDFSYYLQHRPGAYLFVGAQPAAQAFPHHSPQFRLNEAALPIGVEVLYRGVMAEMAAFHPGLA